jgi:hypothetical protein
LPGFDDGMVKSCILEPFDVTIRFIQKKEKIYVDFNVVWSCNLVLAMKRIAAKNKSFCPGAFSICVWICNLQDFIVVMIF